MSVAIVGILVGIKSNHMNWDGPGALSSDQVDAISRVMTGSGNLYGAAGVQVANLISSGAAPPDVGGVVEVFTRDGTWSAELPKVQDSFSPTWNTAEFEHVPLDRSVRIRATFVDRDLVDDDPMGVVELNVDDLAAALAEARIHHVRVDDQSNGQVLFVDVSVRAE